MFLVGWTANAKTNPPNAVDASFSGTVVVEPVVVHNRFDIVNFSANTFKEDIETYISQLEYGNAMKLLMLAPVDEILNSSGENQWYCAVDDSMPGSIKPNFDIILPGAKKNYDSSRDWVIPGSDDCLTSALWYDYCRIFAKRFNRRKDKTKGIAQREDKQMKAHGATHVMNDQSIKTDSK